MISWIALIISLIIFHDRYWKHSSKSLSKKIQITGVRYKEEFGDTNEQTHGVSLVSVKVKNNSKYILQYYTCSLIFKNKETVFYQDIYGIMETIRPKEEKLVHVFTYITDVYESPENPILYPNFNGKENSDEIEAKMTTYMKNIARKDKRFHEAAKGIEKVKTKVKSLFQTTDDGLVKEIIKNASISIGFKSNNILDTNAKIVSTNIVHKIDLLLNV